MRRRFVVASQCKFDGQIRGVPAPCFTPDFTDDNELYEKFGGLNEIALAQQKSQYSDLFRMRLQNIDPPQSLYDGLDDKIIMDNVLPKYASVNDVFHLAHVYEEQLKESQKSNDNGD